MAQSKTPKQLSKFLAYVLGRQPDEFGLIPDEQGFIKIKELLKAVNEEEGWKFVRRHHINEILFTLPDPAIEIKEDTIRAKNPDNLPRKVRHLTPPKILYTCVRRKAHPATINRGILPMGHSKVVLFASRDMAEKVGKRIDAMPVLLTVHTTKTMKQGVVFYQFGRSIFLADAIPPGCFSAPPLPKPKAQPQKEVPAGELQPQRTPGAFLLDMTDQNSRRNPVRRRRHKKEIAWKKERKNNKKRKNKIWSDL